MKTWMKLLCVLFLMGCGVHTAKAAATCAANLNIPLKVTVFTRATAVVANPSVGAPIPLGPWQQSATVNIGQCPVGPIYAQMQLASAVAATLSAAEAGCNGRTASLEYVQQYGGGGGNSPVAVALALTLSANNNPPTAATTQTCLNTTAWKPTLSGISPVKLYAQLWVRPYLVAPVAPGTSANLVDGDNYYFLGGQGIRFGQTNLAADAAFRNISIQFDSPLAFVTPTCGFVPDVFQSLGNHAPSDFATAGTASAYYDVNLVADRSCNVSNMRLTFQGNSYPGDPSLFATYEKDNVTSTGLGVELDWNGTTPAPIQIKPNDSLDMPVKSGAGAVYPFKARLVHPDNSPLQSGAGHADITVENFYY